MSNLTKKTRGDRSDAWLVQGLDPLHNIMNQLMGKRTENEAVSTLELDMTALSKYIEHKNQDINPKFKYTFFHAVLAALARTVNERKCMNYFVRDMKIYERKVISFCYVAKRQFTDNAEENLCIQEYHPESDVSPINQFHDRVTKDVSTIRESEDNYSPTAALINTFLKMPKPILNLVFSILRRMDSHGRLPYSLSKDVPYYTTAFVSNLGSIKFNATYHHLCNFGTNSLFVIIGKKHLEPEYKKDGSFVMKEYLPITFTLDERIADGVYFANSFKMFQALLLKPEMLDLPANQKINFEKLYNEVYGEEK